MGCIAFTVLGLIVLACVPVLTLALKNLSVFVVGAFPGALAFGYLYGRAFTDGRNELDTTAAVLGSFAMMLIGAIAGGTASVWLTVRWVGVSRRNHSR
jgi:hypothetical protein